MTGINSVSSGMEGVQGIGPSPGKDSRLKVLEQKLAQLKGEKEKAVKNRDKEKVKELEKEIQKVEQQIEQLKRREKKGKKEENSQWNAPKAAAVTEEHIVQLSALLEEYEPAYTNWNSMPPSVKKTYTRAYFDAKTDAGREKRIAWIVDRLNRNLKPM